MTRRIAPWQTMQRRLAEAASFEASGYPGGGGSSQLHWWFASATGSWLNRNRSGVVRSRKPRLMVKLAGYD